jgi:plasmid stability protein
MNLSIKNVPEEVVERLRERAKRNRRSMQGELLVIVEEALTPSRLTISELGERVRQLGLRTGDDATAMIREDRDAR